MIRRNSGESFDVGSRSRDRCGGVELEIGKKHTQGTLESVDSGGAQLTPENTNVKVTWKGQTPLKGTFKTGKLSGSWSCAGHIYSQQAG